MLANKRKEKYYSLQELLNQKVQWNVHKQEMQKYVPQISREILKKIRQGEFWIYKEQVKNFNELASAFPFGGFVSLQGGGLALFDNHNPIALRVLEKQNKRSDLKPYLKKTLLRAITIRKEFFPLLQAENPNNKTKEFATTGIRLLHGENDFLPGLTADLYDNLLVYRLDSLTWFSVLSHIDNILKEQLSFSHSYIISRYARGWLSQEPSNNIFHFKENNLNFEVDPTLGQKTGFFLDMRENRVWLTNLCQNKNILNAFSYTSAFSVYALNAGAASVTNIDISTPALEAAKRNHELNGLPKQKQTLEFISADVLSWLQKLPVIKAREKGMFDIIILDPPAYAHAKDKVSNALHAYYNLNKEALLRLSSGQFLCTACCSPRVSYDDFFKSVVKAADDSRRKLRLLYSQGAGIDHPYTPNEIFSAYLKFFVFYVESD